MESVNNLILPHEYDARKYQEEFWSAAEKGYKRFCLVWHRRAGKEKTCWNYMIYKAFMEPGIYYYLFPHFSQGRKIIWDGMDKSGKKFLDHIPSNLLATHPNATSMMIKLKCAPQPDGKSYTSVIQILGTNNYDSIMGTNPSGCVFSEYSLQDPNAWQYIRPILTENKGWAIFNFCVAPDTLIMSSNGIQTIESVCPESRPGFTDINLPVYGINSYNTATNFYNGGEKVCLKITTNNGYNLTCTPNHPIWDGTGWKKAQDYVIGDYIPIQNGQQAWGNGLDISNFPRRKKRSSHKDLPKNFKMTSDIAYLLGLVISEGSWSKNHLTITNADKKIHEFLLDFGFTQSDEVHFYYCSEEFINFIEWFGCKKGAKNKEIPSKLLLFPKNIIISFLQGYFDGDGCAHKRGTVDCTSASEKLISQIQILLLNFGIIGKKYKSVTRPTKKVKKECICFRLELTKYSSSVFFREIGFRLPRKQSRYNPSFKNTHEFPYSSCWADKYKKGLNISSYLSYGKMTYWKANNLLKIKDDCFLKQTVKNGYFYDKVKSIENVVSSVYDFVIPETNSFFSNGFISHNTPRGINWAKDLYDMAEKNPDWFCQKLTVDDTGIISPEDIDAERQGGMSEDYIQQEFYCSFTLGIEGSYYGWYLQKARDEERITNVNWAPQSPVHTAMDLGYGDATAIVFYQLIGKEIHIIDYYENQGKDFAHYAKIIQEKPYVYGKYYAPSDAGSKTLSTGLSVQDVASSLGIPLTIIPTVAIPVDSGIEAARSLFASIWIDEKKCQRLIKCLENYQKALDDKNQVYRDKPLHNWASHGADAFRYCAVAVKMYGNGSGGVDDKEYEKMKNKYLPRFN